MRQVPTWDMAEAIVLTTTDGLTLEAEVAHPPGDAPTRGAAVLCHPHPQHGGSMRSLVIGALFEGLPAAGVRCLRFNFRGVEASAGSYSGGRTEPRDVVAAIDALIPLSPPRTPVMLAGWSFGADMALAVVDHRVATWFAVAPPLRFGDGGTFSAVAADTRPKVLALAQRDQFRAPEEVQAEVASWVATRTVVVGGADHFFVGRTHRLVELAVEVASELRPG